MEKIIITYDLNKLFITINYYELTNNISINQTKRYLIKDYDTKEKINLNLYNDILDSFNLDIRDLQEEFYDNLSDLLNNLCKELKIDK